MFLDSNPTVFTFRSWLDLLRVVLACWIYNKKSSNHFEFHPIDTDTDITSF